MSSTFGQRFFALLTVTLGTMLLVSNAQARPDEPPVHWKTIETRAQRALMPTVTATELGRLTLAGGPANLMMSGIRNRLAFSFPMRRDEIITNATLDLRWHASPALIPIKSQLLVKLNDEYQTALPIPKERPSDLMEARITLDPKKLKDTNHLSFEFLGSYAAVCENPASSSLWASIESNSVLTLTHQKLRAADDLSLLPAPFVDQADAAALPLSVALPANASDTLLQSAGVVASWVGVASDWRGAKVNVSINAQPPETHFIVLMTDDRRPEFLKDWPKAQGPEITMADAPNSDWAKMLILSGRTDDELLIAARALATRSESFTGRSVQITDLVRLTPPQPYRVPKWVDTSHKTTLGELQTYAGQLDARGVELPPLRVNFRLPPDLFVLTRSTIPLNLKYRYTPPEKHAHAQLRLFLNDSLIRTLPLKDDGEGSSLSTTNLTAVDTLTAFLREIDVPAVLFGPENHLTFDFAYSTSLSGGSPENCRTITLIPNEAALDPSSTLDFTGFYHFAPMPNVGLFHQSGYPFTIYGDLSQTTVVLPPKPNANLMAAMLTTMARLGSQTGAPAHAVTVTTVPSEAALQNRDVLVIGAVPECLTPHNETQPSLALTPTQQRLTAPDEVVRQVLHKAQPHDQQVDQVVAMMANGPAAAVAGYESPVTPGRSVVALMATPGAGEVTLIERLATPHALTDTGGTLSFIHPVPAVNFMTEPAYFLGNLPWHQRLWYRLLDHPLLLILCALAAVIAVGLMVYGLMHLHNRRRLSGTRPKEPKA